MDDENCRVNDCIKRELKHDISRLRAALREIVQISEEQEWRAPFAEIARKALEQ